MFQEYSEKNHPELPALTIIQGGGTVLREESDRNLQYDKSSLSGYKMVCENDFIVHLRSFEGGLEKSSHKGLISPAYHTFHGDNVDSRFYYSYFRSYEFIKHKLVPHVYGIRDGRSIDIDGMKTIEIPYTSYEEQKKIGDYIESLDHLITLHQRKSFYNIANINVWEQRKFSELYEKNVEKNTELIGYDKTISIATMTYKDEGNGASDESLKTYKVLRTGDLAFEGHTNKDFRYGRFVANDIGTGIMSPRFSTLRPVKDMPVSFWKYYIHYEPIMRSVLVNSTKAGTMMNELVVADFMKQSIRVPSIGEQEKIGEYFSTLDHLITLHQRKCDDLKNLKKYMLQNMFV